MGCEQSKPSGWHKPACKQPPPPPDQPQNAPPSEGWDDFYVAAIAAFVERHVAVRPGSYVSADAVFCAFQSFCDPIKGFNYRSRKVCRTMVLRHVAASAAAMAASDADQVTLVFDSCSRVAFVVNLELTSFPVLVANENEIDIMSNSCMLYEFFRPSDVNNRVRLF
jgi:hypothetical protein